MRRLLLASLALGLALPLTARAAPPEMTPTVEGPDVPTSTAAKATVTVFDKAVFSFGLKPPVLDRTVKALLPKAPAGGWDRVLMEVTDTPDDQEPWDRVLSVSVGKVELLRATTPRSTFTMTKDVTEYASLLSGRQPFSASIGTYTGSHQLTVKLAFYDGEQPVHAPFARVVGGFSYVGIEPEHKEVARRTAQAKVAFGKTAPASAVLEMTTSGHLQGGEFWYLPDRGSTTPPVFHVKVDGTEVATAHGLPYTYALVGFEGMNETAHPLMWWTAQQALDKAGVHNGTGEIPSYRASLPADVAATLKGSKTVEVVVEGKGLWITSVSLLLG